jgi:predicted RND superfamily exporter protein
MKSGLPQFESPPRFGFLAPLLNFFVETLIRFRLVILPGALIATALVWPIADQLEFDQSVESLYADNDPHLEAYRASARHFGGDEFAIIAWQETGLFDEDGDSISDRSLKRIEAVADEIAGVPGLYPDSIQHAGSAERLKDTLVLLGVSNARERVTEMVRGALIGSDRETTAVVVRLKPESESEVPRGETIAKIREIAAAHDPPAFVVGEPVQVHDMFRYVEEDGRILFRFSLVMLAVVLFAMFRSVRWVVLPLLLVVLTIRWTEVLLVLVGAKLSMVSSMMNSLVTIVGVATATHLAVGFRDRMRTLPRREALQQTLTELLPAIFWACATTAVGFTALLMSSITPVRSFGLMMAVATGLAFLVVCFVAPAGMANREQPLQSDPSESAAKRTLKDLLFGDPVAAPAEQYLETGLRGVSQVATWKPGLAFMGAVVVFLVCAAGLTRLEIETDFSQNFRDESELIKSLNFVESKLGGAGTWELNFAAPDKLTEEYLAKVRKLTSRLREELVIPPGESTELGQADGRLTKIVSLTDGLDLVPDRIFFKTLDPESKFAMFAGWKPEVAAGLYNREAGRMRLVLRAVERQRSEPKRALMQRVMEIAREEFSVADNETEGAPATTGLFVLLTFLIERLLHDQVYSFIAAGIGIGLMMTIAFRSWRIGLISLVPNLFPIVCLVGTMGWVGVPINIATAMIASVSMGLTVDNSVHYLSAYRRARRQGLSVARSIERTQTQVGRALVFANVALVSGFSVLTLSNFIPLVYFGILVSVAMLGGLAGNLFLLPLMLSKIDSDDAHIRETVSPDAEPIQPEETP